MKKLIKRIENGIFNWLFPKKINLTPEELLNEIYQFVGEKGVSGEVKIGLIDFMDYLIKK